jgi:hypothetical protein
MKSRCNNPANPKYRSYGERGIKVCEEWENNYFSFREWAMKNGYKEGLSIDRKDNNKGYSPDNCRWTTRIVQQNNMRSNVYLEYQGERHTVSEWWRITGIPRATIGKRMKRGWSAEQILTTEPANTGAHIYMKRRTNEKHT